MNLDFTLAKYEELCSAIVQSGYDAVSVKDYLSRSQVSGCRIQSERQRSLSLQPGEKVVILRHDVDRKPEKALKMAYMERQFDIQATYYFRTTGSLQSRNPAGNREDGA